MRILGILWILVIVGCGMFNPVKYNPNPTPKIVVEEPVKMDTVRTDTVKIIIIE